MSANAFVQQPPSSTAKKQVHVQLSNNDENNDVEISRRVAFTKSAATFASIASIAVGKPGFAFAAKTPPTADELNRIKTGYERMCYLLENFEQETTICRVSLSTWKNSTGVVKNKFNLFMLFHILFCHPGKWR